ncbi:putative WD repeat protein [Rosellinia necatrix]|uniref:Probable cytosolic iron-sulfur protein assembly protein 1 n=1 Tax=Rosellinia necatrix TaxID=77044 RepID=A0A1W2TUF3_ROSNE|nr:putative WD repeat protein [Rosellinia necatrix]
MSTPESAEQLKLVPLPPFKPDLYERCWQSVPHPTLPLLATTHQKSVTVFSLSTLSAHSALTNGHERSVRSATWKPNLPPHQLCLVTGSFDSTAGLWRWQDEGQGGGGGSGDSGRSSDLEVEITGGAAKEDAGEKDWELIVVLDGHDSEIKSVAFSPSGQFLATCSRDKSVWVWEDVGSSEADDEWETVAVLNEHDGDVKAVAWCPDTNRSGRGRYSNDVLASASYDDTVRIWREDGEGEWVCVAVLQGHKGTVWGVQWEPNPKSERFPRLLTWSADRTIRVWTLKEERDEADAPRHAWGGLGGIPNTMRRSLKEEWNCTAVLPTAHSRDIYSATWSAETGLVASVGSDGVIAVYKEEPHDIIETEDTIMEDEATAELNDDLRMFNGSWVKTDARESKYWELVSTTPNAHGPYEINHITWCKRYDAGCPPEKKGVEEMLITTGDDGVVRPWQIS